VTAPVSTVHSKKNTVTPGVHTKGGLGVDGRLYNKMYRSVAQEPFFKFRFFIVIRK